MDNTSWYSYACVVPSHCIPGLDFMTNRIRQKWWYTSLLRIGYERYHDFHLGLSLSLSLSFFPQPAPPLSTPASSPCRLLCGSQLPRLNRPTWWGTEASCQQPGEWAWKWICQYQGSLQLPAALGQQFDCGFFRDPQPEPPSKAAPDFPIFRNSTW